MRHYFQVEGDISSPSYNRTQSCPNGASMLASNSDSGVKSESSGESSDSSSVPPPNPHSEDEEEGEFEAPNDPFYDRLPWFQIIGRWALFKIIRILNYYQ